MGRVRVTYKLTKCPKADSFGLKKYIAIIYFLGLWCAEVGRLRLQAA